MSKCFNDYTRRMIWELAKEYADSPAECSRTYFCKKEGISQGTFYKLLHAAIEEWIVDEDIARRIARKSELNAGLGSESEAGARQSRHAYDESFKKRENYEISRSTAKKYAIMYAYSQFPQSYFKRAELMPTRFFNALLKKAIIEGIVSDEVVNALKIKALRNNDSTSSVYDFFADLEQQRKEYKKDKKTRAQKHEEQKKAQKDFAQMSIDDYGIPDEMDEYMDSMKED